MDQREVVTRTLSNTALAKLRKLLSSTLYLTNTLARSIKTKKRIQIRNQRLRKPMMRAQRMRKLRKNRMRRLKRRRRHLIKENLIILTQREELRSSVLWLMSLVTGLTWTFLRE